MVFKLMAAGCLVGRGKHPYFREQLGCGRGGETFRSAPHIMQPLYRLLRLTSFASIVYDDSDKMPYLHLLPDAHKNNKPFLCADAQQVLGG
jgi:hypothetical protein